MIRTLILAAALLALPTPAATENSAFVLTPGMPPGTLITAIVYEGNARTRPRILDTLDLAQQWKGELDRGEVKHHREFARRHGITPARVSQIYALNRLHPTIVEFVRANAVTTERRLKPLLSLEYADQLRAAPRVVVGWGEGLQAPSRRRKRAR